MSSRYCLLDVIEIVKEIKNHISFSPKRLHLFSTKLVQEEITAIKNPYVLQGGHSGTFLECHRSSNTMLVLIAHQIKFLI